MQYSSDQQKLLLDCAFAQGDLRLCWSHTLHCWKSHVAAQLTEKICITVAFNTYNIFSRLYRTNQTSFRYLIFIKADSVFFKLMFLAINFGCFVTFFCVVDFSSLSSFEFILLKKIDLISLLLLCSGSLCCFHCCVSLSGDALS